MTDEVAPLPLPTDTVARGAAPRRNWFRTIRNTVIVIVCLFGLLAALFHFGVPYAATSFAPKWVKEKTGRELKVAAASFNPFTLDLKLSEVSLADGARTLARFDALEIDGAWSSIRNWAFTTHRLTLRKPQINAHINKDGSLDWSRFLDALPKSTEPANPDAGVPRMLLGNVEIIDAAIRLTDDRATDGANTAARRSVALEPLSLKLEKLSTLPRDRGEYSLNAVLNDQTRVQWRGRVGLNPIDSSGDLLVSKLPIAKTLGLLGVALPVSVDGLATLRANYSVAAGTDFVAAGVGGGAIDIADLIIRSKTAVGDDTATMKSVALSPISFSWVRRNAVAPAPPLVSYAIEPLSAALQSISVNTAKPDTSAFAALTSASIDTLAVNVVEQIISVSRVQLNGVQANVVRDQRGNVTLPFASVGSGATAPNSAPAAPLKTWRVNLPDVSMEKAKLSFRDTSFAVPQRASANIDVALGVAIESGANAVAQISSKTVRATDLSLRDASPDAALPWLSIKEIRLPAFGFDALAANIELPKLDIIAPQIVSNLSATGYDLSQKFAAATVTTGGSAVAAAVQSKAANAAPAKRVSLGGIALSSGRFTLLDNTLAAPLNHTLEAVALSTDRIEFDGSKPIISRVNATLASGGTLKGAVSFDTKRSETTADLSAEKIALAPFSPYLNQYTRLKINRGEFSSAATMKFYGGRSAEELWRANASAKLTGVEVFDEVAQIPFASWGELSSTDIAVRSTAQGVDVALADLLLDEAKTRLIIGADRSINLAQIGKPAVNTATVPAAPATSAGAPPMPSDAAPTTRIKVARLQVTGGDLEFADLSLRPQFGTRISDLAGLVVGISNEPSARAEVSLEGKVDQFGLARLSGTIAPLGATDYTKLKAAFRNLEMASLTPYSGKFAGRAIKSGKLTLDLDYSIEQRTLKGENTVLIDNLVLGDKIDSPDATNLPLDLAIALLRDSDGKIDLGLPVQGSLDDPQFSYGSLIWKAIGNVLTKIATAPFRALGALLGGSGESFEAVIFEPGEARLLPPEREKLAKLSKALSQRPALKLTIEGRFDKARDREALADNIVKLDISKRAGMKPPGPNEPLIISFTDAKVQTALDDMAASAGDDAVKLRAKYLPPANNAVTNLIQNARAQVTEKGRTEAAAARAKYYPELFALLRSKQDVPEFAYAALASLRAEAIRNTVVGVNNFDAARVSVAAPQAVAQSKADQVAVTLALSVK